MSSKKNELGIEALRGFCAIGVLIVHVIFYSKMLQDGFELASYMPSGILLVLVFFCLSGYVIGITTKTADSLNVFEYFKKRFVRIYPIYFIVLTFSILLSNQYSWNLFLNYFFLQNIATEAPKLNNPLWSLNYEVVYYLLFVPFFFIRKKVFLIILIMGFVSILLVKYWLIENILLGYLVGFVFWLSGYFISTFDINNTRVDSSKAISIMVLLLAAGHLNILDTILMGSGLNFLPMKYFNGIIDVSSLSLLFFCICAVIICSGRCPKIENWLLYSCYFLCIIDICYSHFKGLNISLFAVLFLLASISVHFIGKVDILMTLLSKIGTISYSVYVLHMPVLIIIGYCPVSLGGNIEFMVRILLLVVVVFAGAYFLEKKLQPIFKRGLLNGK